MAVADSARCVADDFGFETRIAGLAACGFEAEDAGPPDSLPTISCQAPNTERREVRGDFGGIDW